MGVVALCCGFRLWPMLGIKIIFADFVDDHWRYLAGRQYLLNWMSTKILTESHTGLLALQGRYVAQRVLESGN